MRVRALRGRVHDQRRAAGYARFADLPGDDRRMRRRSAASRENAFGDGHAVEVVRRRFDADEHDALAALGPRDGVVGVEHGAAHGGAGRCIQALREARSAVAGAGRELIAQQLLDVCGLDSKYRLLLADQPFLDHVDGDLDGGRRRAFRGARLQHEQPPSLDRELEVLHVAIVALELSAIA